MIRFFIVNLSLFQLWDRLFKTEFIAQLAERFRNNPEKDIRKGCEVEVQILLNSQILTFHYL